MSNKIKSTLKIFPFIFGICYFNENTYTFSIGLKRTFIALYYEGKIFINYKLVSKILSLFKIKEWI